LGAALAIAFLGAAEAAILSAPAALYLSRPPRPMGEFDGVAAFGEMLVVAGAVAAIVFVGMFAFVVTRRKTASWITPLGWTLCAALAVVTITLLMAHFQNGILWGFGLSATILIIGLVRVLRLGAAMNSGDISVE
jgi:hypothetical protein